MNNFFRTIIAGWGAKKLGGGCLSTIIIFAVIYMMLGKCNNGTRAAAPKFKSEKPLVLK
ncbi:hypothetical protein QG516_01010 [Pedobacter gandavensis]|uniref:hypothetical protein n=1 Tax=Pedobacter TaxID=84567 RepID=UPI001C9930A5|nr:MULTISPECIES: hypothetical protein [Pedobacter]WGQ10230.1 hypothetical protein QG516_01010 [Pedobacter gandavensis]